MCLVLLGQGYGKGSRDREVTHKIRGVQDFAHLCVFVKPKVHVWTNRQHRTRRLPENLFGNRTEKGLSKPRAPAGPKYNQVDFLLLDQIGDHFTSLTLADHYFVVDALELFIQASGV